MQSPSRSRVTLKVHFCSGSLVVAVLQDLGVVDLVAGVAGAHDEEPVLVAVLLVAPADDGVLQDQGIVAPAEVELEAEVARSDHVVAGAGLEDPAGIEAGDLRVSA